MAALNVGNLGEFLREQRRTAQLSLRQLADAAGVSNPYLSQIERGLRKPSAEILQQLAKALRISAETLYVQAGILDARDRAEAEVTSAILTDPTITERQKQVLLQIYESFRKENGTESGRPTSAADHEGPAPAAPAGTAPEATREGIADAADSGPQHRASGTPDTDPGPHPDATPPGATTPAPAPPRLGGAQPHTPDEA
ncbi:helix-turn-helix transcriptional regulator [Streptomyces sp. 71268]|uniref:helix-turn-helix domain-containing protein n=1 Tax=Streptomyces sp. 71268 TaxID=3002640 RepID=UPI0023F9E6CC|nr:helix-turn-helix transcriptional regulator [Streptomyces sp. 71268]WEV26999.1 helix-turn-helix transcriptional regulator [Streptomyces sp. 71268]